MIRHIASLPLLFLSLTASAQEQPTISPLVSFDYGNPLFINRAPGVLSPFPGTVSGNSLSESFGVGAEFTFPEIVAGHIGLMGLIEGVYSRGYFDFNGYSVSGIDRKLLLEVSALWDVQPFAIRAGPWVSEAISRDIYENGLNGVPVASGDSIASAPTHFGLTAGLAWDIPNFPLRPEINTHLDLTELGLAGLNAWSFGISLSYSFGGGVARASARSKSGDSERVETRSTPIVPSRVRFLVDRSEIIQDVPLERVEMRVKEYRMVDSANAAPRVAQWVVESYHLPQISVLCEVDRDAAGKLQLMNDSTNLAELSVMSKGASGLTFDTTFDLEKVSEWQNALTLMNINEGNRVIAQLVTVHSDVSDTIRDTLLLPAVDTSRAVRTIVKKQFRFYLSDRFTEFEGGGETLDLLLGRMKALLDSNVRITISEPSKPGSATHNELKKRVFDALGIKPATAHREESANLPGGLLVLLDL